MGRPILCKYKEESQVVFSKLTDFDLSTLEQELAYFFCVPDIKKVSEHYIKALDILEESSSLGLEKSVKDAMISHLNKAYDSVASQTKLEFDTRRAAELEAELIIAQSKKENFEILQDILVRIYTIVFGCKREEVVKACMLRTFLYKYKVYLLNCGKPLNVDDRNFLTLVAKESEKILNKVKKLSVL